MILMRSKQCCQKLVVATNSDGERENTPVCGVHRESGVQGGWNQEKYAHDFIRKTTRAELAP